MHTVTSAGLCCGWGDMPCSTRSHLQHTVSSKPNPTHAVHQLTPGTTPETPGTSTPHKHLQQVAKTTWLLTMHAQTSTHDTSTATALLHSPG